MSARNNLINLVGVCSGILSFILFCKYISLFFNRKTDIKPFLMSKNWMIFAIVASAISILALVMNLMKDKKNMLEIEHKGGTQSTAIIAISAAIGLPTIVSFSLYLAGVISENAITTFTKILVVAHVMLVAMTIALMCCCCLCCVYCTGVILGSAQQSAVKDDGSVLKTEVINFNFTIHDQNLDPKLPSNDNQELPADGRVVLEKADQDQVRVDQENSKFSRSMSVGSSDQLNVELALVA